MVAPRAPKFALGVSTSQSYIREIPTGWGPAVLSRMPGDQPSRRTFTLGVAAAVTAFAVPATAALAQDQVQAWELAVRKIVGEAKPTEGKFTLDLPEIAENGNTVPFTVSRREPDDGEGLRQGDPRHRHRQPAARRGDVPLHARCRARRPSRAACASPSTQDVIGIAELSDGRFLMAKRPVKVTIGGCGG